MISHRRQPAPTRHIIFKYVTSSKFSTSPLLVLRNINRPIHFLSKPFHFFTAHEFCNWSCIYFRLRAQLDCHFGLLNCCVWTFLPYQNIHSEKRSNSRRKNEMKRLPTSTLQLYFPLHFRSWKYFSIAAHTNTSFVRKFCETEYKTVIVMEIQVHNTQNIHSCCSYWLQLSQFSIMSIWY